jgi:hypothetical protein
MRTTYIRFCSTALAQAASSKVAISPSGGRAVVVHQNVDAAQGACDGIDDAGAILGAAAVGGNRQHFGSGLGANGLGCALEIRLAPRCDGHPRAFGCQQVGNTVADALAGAADDGDLVFQVEIHATPMSARKAAPLVWKILVRISSV